MSKLTITEALAEVTTIEKRIAKKRQFVRDYLYRQEQLRDPLEGGSDNAIAKELQGIGDLEERRVRIRGVISESNAGTDVSVNGSTRSVAGWLVWRREIAPQQQTFFTQLRSDIQRVRQEAQSQGVLVVAAEGAAKPGDVIINLDEQDLATQSESLEETLGFLDGQLSLKNATTFVEL
jgi:hypothetical protein